MFDPYLDWLKIPAQRRPPTHYELLGLPEFESDAGQIHKAAMERMAVVRRYQLGENADTVTRLLAEISAAFNCLSDADRRRAYDEQLRSAAPLPATGVIATASLSSTANQRAQPVAMAPASASASVSSLDLKGASGSNLLPRRRRPALSLTAAWLTVGLFAIVLVVAVWRAVLPPADVEHVIQQTDSPSTGVVSGSSTPPVKSASVARQELPQETAAPSARTIAASQHSDVPSAASPPSGEPGASHLRYFGYGTAGPPRVIEEIAPYTNVVFVRDWVDRSSETIVAAESAGLPIVLCLSGKEMFEGGTQLKRILSRRSASLLAVCWIFPYLSGYKPVDVIRVGKQIKADHPAVQYWMASGLGQAESDPIPPVVDALVAVDVASSTPESVRSRAEERMPGLLSKAAGRPVVWYWFSGGPRQPKNGVVPLVEPGTYRAALDVARRFQLAGLGFERYGDPKGQERVPINARPELVAGIRRIAGELGFDKDASSAARPQK